jgi:hypothetical protein
MVRPERFESLPTDSQSEKHASPLKRIGVAGQFEKHGYGRLSLGLAMSHGFDSYRVFISAPGDLGRDRQACYDTISHINESIAMQAKVLMVSIGLRDSEQIVSHREITSDNVRWSSYFIQVFQDDWGPRDLFRKLFLLALECRDDPAAPMQDVVVCLKDAPHERNADVLEFRRDLEERTDVRVIRYATVEQMREELEKVCASWAQAVIAQRQAAGADGDGAELMQT